MLNLSDDLRTKLLQAKSAEEAAALLRGTGADAPLAERIWKELTHQRASDGRELSLDELETVSGGARNWATEGCAATVEPGSHCWSDDHCAIVVEFYDNAPVSVNCPKCGMYFYKETRGTDVYYVCKACKHTQFAYSDVRDKAK